MKVHSICIFVLAVGFASCGLIPANTFIRAPSYNSAFVGANQVGGNFAYSAFEQLGYPGYSPYSQHVHHPVVYTHAAHPLHFGYQQAPVHYYTPSVLPPPGYFGINHFGVNHIPPTNEFFGKPVSAPTEPPSDNASTEKPEEATTDEQGNSEESEDNEDSVSVEAA